MINSDRLFINMDGNKLKSERSRTVKLFKMKAERGRWIFAVPGLAVNVCRGSTYSWNVFRLPLRKLWSVDATASLLPSIFPLTFFALPTPVAGRSLDEYGRCRPNGYA